MNNQSSRYLIKLNNDTGRANMVIGKDRFPVWLVLDNQNREATGAPWRCRFAWAVKGHSFETALGAHSSPSGESIFASDDIDIQLEKDGEFVNFAEALLTGVVGWGSWEEEYLRIGLLEAKDPDVVDKAQAGEEVPSA